MSADIHFPPTGFYFKVIVDDIDESNFQEVSGIDVKIGVQSVQEDLGTGSGYQLPRPTKYDNIVLKRGLVSSQFAKWAAAAVNQFQFSPKSASISLMSENSVPIAVWEIDGAYPVAIQATDLKTEGNNNAVIEQLEIAYTILNVKANSFSKKN